MALLFREVMRSSRADCGGLVPEPYGREVNALSVSMALCTGMVGMHQVGQEGRGDNITQKAGVSTRRSDRAILGSGRGPAAA